MEELVEAMLGRDDGVYMWAQEHSRGQTEDHILVRRMRRLELTQLSIRVAQKHSVEENRGRAPKTGTAGRIIRKRFQLSQRNRAL
eukprot:765017-Pelagomonas_calceolata.AAC.10